MTLGRADADKYLAAIGARYYTTVRAAQVYWVPRMRQYAVVAYGATTAEIEFQATCPCSG